MLVKRRGKSEVRKEGAGTIFDIGSISGVLEEEVFKTQIDTMIIDPAEFIKKQCP